MELRRKLFFALALPVILMGVAFAPVAAAVPPSAVDQYAEHVPEAGGDKPKKELSRGQGPPLPKRTELQLAESGRDGAALERMITNTGTKRAGKPGQVKPRESGSGGSGLGDAIGELGDSRDSGMGQYFVLLLIAAAIVLPVLALLRSLSRRSPGP